MKTENMPTENRALNAKLLLLIAKQRKKLFSMNSNLKICEEQAKRREETLNNLLDFQKKTNRLLQWLRKGILGN